MKGNAEHESKCSTTVEVHMYTIYLNDGEKKTISRISPIKQNCFSVLFRLTSVSYFAYSYTMTYTRMMRNTTSRKGTNTPISREFFSLRCSSIQSICKYARKKWSNASTLLRIPDTNSFHSFKVENYLCIVVAMFSRVNFKNRVEFQNFISRNNRFYLRFRSWNETFGELYQFVSRSRHCSPFLFIGMFLTRR